MMVSSENRVGVDVEGISSKVEKVKHKFLSIAEQEMLQALLQDNLLHHDTKFLTLAWSIKESLFKWYGIGEMDFIEHMHIENIIANENTGIAHCKISRDTETDLVAHFLIFDNNCISWVIS